MIGSRAILPRLAVCLLLGAVISQGSCSKQPAPHIPQEGELVTWRLAPELVIRTRLGERREHVSTGQYDSHFYRPHAEQYIGQFPVDYQPERLEKISVAESNKWSADPMSIKGTLEFNLMLNGSNFTATDANINGPNGLDHVDQVKVEIQRRGIGDTWTSTADDYKQLKARKGLGEYDEDFSSRYLLDCYIYPNKAGGKKGRVCYGQSLNPKISALEFQFMSDSWIFIRAYEPIYGGLKVKVRFDHSNLAQWQQIDAAIWRLLDGWNVAPKLTAEQSQSLQPKS